MRRTASGFAPTEYIELPGVTSSVVIAGLDGDGRNDVAAALLDAGSVAVILRRKNNRGFRPPLFFDAGPSPLVLAAADRDAEGDTDLIVGDRDSGDIRLLVNGAKRPK